MEDFRGLKIYFSPCGIGLGHVMRSVSIAEELEHKGAKILFSTYLDGFNYLKKHGFPVISSPPVNLASDSTGKIDIRALAVKQGIHPIRFIQQVTSEIEHLKAFNPDVVVADTRLSTVLAGKLLGLPVVLILNQFQPIFPRGNSNLDASKIIDGSILTLLGRGWASSDIILIPDFPEPYTICLDSLRIPKKYRNMVEFIGYILKKRPEDLPEKNKIRREIDVPPENNLIYAAISGPNQERTPLIKLLKTIFEEFPENYKIIMSMGVPENNSAPTYSGVLTSIPWVDDPFKFLKACDVVVCRGGHNTIMQAICYRKPLIVIPTPNHTEQYANARRAKELGVAEAIHQQDLSKFKILKLTERLKTDLRYTKNLEDINLKGFNEGIKNTVRTISKLLHKNNDKKS